MYLLHMNAFMPRQAVAGFDSFLLRKHLTAASQTTCRTEMQRQWSILKRERSHSLGSDVGNFPRGVSEFTDPFYIAFDNFISEPEVSVFIEVGVFRQMLFQ